MPRPKSPPKRRLRNYLLKPRFQLKYAGAVFLVSVLVGSVPGYFAYRESVSMSEMLLIQYSMNAVTDDLQSSTVDDIQNYDQRVLLWIVIFIATLACVFGTLGIWITHKVVGPAYKIERLINEVAEGNLAVRGNLRKGDFKLVQRIMARLIHTRCLARRADELAAE